MKKEIVRALRGFVLNSYSEILGLIGYQKYKHLLTKNKTLQDQCKGKKCFVIGSGPSIKKHEITKINDFVVISLNNMYCNSEVNKLLRKSSYAYHIVAPIHPPQTTVTWLEWFREMDNSLPEHVVIILGIDIYKLNAFEILKEESLFENRIVYWYFAGKRYNFNGCFNKRHMDFSKRLYKGRAVSIYAQMLTEFLGVSETYLIGLDHDYFLYDSDKDMRSYDNAVHQKLGIQSEVSGNFYTEEMLRQYEIFKMYEAIDNHSNNRTYNATEGGVLRVFPRVKFLDAIQHDS